MHVQPCSPGTALVPCGAILNHPGRVSLASLLLPTSLQASVPAWDEGATQGHCASRPSSPCKQHLPPPMSHLPTSLGSHSKTWQSCLFSEASLCLSPLSSLSLMRKSLPFSSEKMFVHPCSQSVNSFQTSSQKYVPPSLGLSDSCLQLTRLCSSLSHHCG